MFRREVKGWAKTCSVLTTELAAIAGALEYVCDKFRQTRIVVFSSSQLTLRTLHSGEVMGPKQMMLWRILEAISELNKMRHGVSFRWVPGHEGIVSNVEADEAARTASSQGGKPGAPARERVRELGGVVRWINQDRSEDPTPFASTDLPGQYTWKMDQALPGKHTLRLYGSLDSDQAATLIQARTGHCRRN